jgi:hypothetical protein
MNGPDPITNVIHDGLKEPIRELLQRKFYGAALLLTLTTIDIVAWLGTPLGRTRASKHDFARWVERHIELQGNTTISGLEWYGARCGVLHTYSPYSDFNSKGLRNIGYVEDMTPAVRYDSAISTELVMVSIHAFVEAFLSGLDKYLIELYSDRDKAKIADERFKKMFHTYPFA